MTNHSSHYTPQFKVWQAKAMGNKPTEANLEAAHMLGCKPGKQALAVAMGLRPDGVTNPQVLYACGNPQNNKRAGLVADAYLKRERAARTAEGHEVYKYTVTPKGLKRIETNKAREAALEAAAKVAESKPAKVVAKPKGEAKAKAPKVSKAKGKPTVPPANELPLVEVEPVSVPEAPSADLLPRNEV